MDKISSNPLLDPFWRINNLYQIVNKQGKLIKFELNWAQKELYEDIWYCNIILKARQLGMSTFVCMLFLDRCLFNPNVSAGIIAHTVDDAQAMFRRVKLAYDSLPVEIRSQITADNDTAQMIKFSNGSSLRVGTSLRSATFQYLHISEFGKICAKYPDKAREIVTGALNTVDAGQYIFIESTADGKVISMICVKRHKTTPNLNVSFQNLTSSFTSFPGIGNQVIASATRFQLTPRCKHISII